MGLRRRRERRSLYLGRRADPRRKCVDPEFDDPIYLEKLENFLAAADINGDGEITGADRSFLSGNWLSEAGEDEMFFPRPKAADAAFAGYEPGGLDVGGDLF